jgi:hypothetical protein
MPRGPVLDFLEGPSDSRSNHDFKLVGATTTLVVPAVSTATFAAYYTY